MTARGISHNILFIMRLFYAHHLRRVIYKVLEYSLLSDSSLLKNDREKVLDWLSVNYL